VSTLLSIGFAAKTLLNLERRFLTLPGISLTNPNIVGIGAEIHPSGIILDTDQPWERKARLNYRSSSKIRDEAYQ